ncbi:MAG: DUF4337 domain-containing protein [Polyangiaceae bacterium]|nr:DUF4337 domain-containing protein [Polyangiaceae bacterium]
MTNEATQQDGSKPKDDLSEDQKGRFEVWFGLSLALFAAVLAINELAGGKYGDDELKMTTEKTSAYLWYQSKGIKESLAEGQRDTLKALIASGSVDAAHRSGIDQTIVELDRKIARYEAEKTEILEGSASLGPDQQVLEVDGAKGKVVGVKDMDRDLQRLSAAGDRFDIATLFLQLCLVFGALGLIVTKPKMKRTFLITMVVGGVLGAALSAMGFVALGVL